MVVVRFGIIGCGFMGRTYAACLSRHTAATRLVAVAGGSRAPALATEFGVDVEPAVEALVSRPDVDAVIIASPPSAHLPQTQAAAVAGKHVYVEKPMARTVAECDAMSAACQSAGVHLAVNKVLRFRMAARAAKSLIDEGTIGEVRMITARYTHYVGSFIVSMDADHAWSRDPNEGSPFLDWGAHCADMLRWLSSQEAQRTYAQYTHFRAESPRSVMAQYALDDGAMAQVWMTYDLPTPGITPADGYLIVGSTGMIDLATFGQVKLDTGDGWRLVAEQPAFDFGSGMLSPDRLQGFAAQVQDFADAIREGRPPLVGAREGRAAVEMIEAAERSAATGLAVTLPLSPSDMSALKT